MAWRKKDRYFRTLLLTLLIFFSVESLRAQSETDEEDTEYVDDYTTSEPVESDEYLEEDWETDNSETEKPKPLPEFPESEKEPVWNDDEWKKAGEDLEYKKKVQEKEEEEEEEELIDDDSGDEVDTDSFGTWLNNVVTSTTGKIIAISIIGILLFLMITRLLATRTDNAKLKEKTPDDELAVILEEIPEETDLEYYLKKALDSGDYKTAVRILYLFVIRQMEIQKLISWKKDKTNHDYLMEMRTHQRYRNFREITIIYEVVWYGDTNISNSDYNNISEFFTQFKTSIDTESEK